jgi:class 3 adenylate cyclase
MGAAEKSISANQLSSREKVSRIFFLFILLVFMTVTFICVFNALDWVGKTFPGFLLNERMVVAPIGQYHWSGSRAGLKYPDKIITADGKPVPTMMELKGVLRNKPVGETVTYTVERGEEVFEVSLLTMRFSWLDLSVAFGTTFIAGLAYMLIGAVVYILKPDKIVSWSLVIACFFLGLWSITTFDMQSTHFGFIRFYLLAAAVFPAALVHFSLFFPEPKNFAVKHPKIQILPYIIALAIAIPMELLYPNRPFALFYSLALLYMIVAAIAVLFPVNVAYFKPVSALGRQRAKVVLMGATIAFPIPVFAYFSQLIFGDFFGFRVQTNFLALLLVFFPASLGYAIVRHNLFDVDVFIKRAVGYVIITAIIIAAYMLVSIPLNVLAGQYELAQSQAFPILFTLAVILVFNPLRNRVQALVDRAFFRKEYDYGQIIDKISGAISSMLDLNQILNRLVGTFSDDMFIENSSVMLLNPAGNEYRVYLAEGEKKQAIEKIALKRQAPLIQIIESEKKEITKYDALEDPKYKKVSRECAENFNGLQASLLVPMVYQNEVTGLFALGEKKSGKFFNRQDIDLLNTIAKQGAVAIENARMVEEIIEKERARAKIMDSFGKYVTSEVRDQILEGRIPLDGELKDVTVLFADLRGFTTLTESTDPKEVVKIINGYFSEMAEAIGQNHGLVLQFIGDEIEAVFGAPSPLEDHPTHAVRAAMAMRERLVSVNQKLRIKGYASLRHGIGIHTGNVVAANIGSEDRLSYALVGDTVNLASRIQSLNKEFDTDILISAITLNRLSEYISGEKLGATSVKGKKEPVEIFKLA